MVFRFRRQHILAGYIVDFYCPTARLAIEVDGSSHAERADEDRERDAALARLGIEVLRFSNDRVVSDIEAVQREVLDACITRTRPTSMVPTQSSPDRQR